MGEQDYTRITFSKFDRNWLNGVCAPLTVTAPQDAAAGRTTSVSVQVTSQQAGDLSGAVTLSDLPAGWTAGTVPVPHLRPDESTTVSVPLTVPAGTATNAYPVRALFTTALGRSTTPNPTQIVVRGGNTIWADTTSRTFDGSALHDVSDQFGAVKDLTGGAVTINFRTTATAAAATLLSSADPISQVRDLVVSLNSGQPYVEFRTGSSTYPLRIQSSVNAADGRDHELIFASSNGISSLILDGQVVGQTAGQRFFRDVDDMTTGLPNLTIGGNRAYVTPPGALTNRWLYTGTIQSIRITS
ncbi:NEW3 domain-containing protein [Kribbella sp. NPDC059898]|uniref:NEW3 domain-containing protein n=1 Tax=Kribbella sp. NPDC059898 TaxID=3346995 RepID=UPI003654AF28